MGSGQCSENLGSRHLERYRGSPLRIETIHDYTAVRERVAAVAFNLDLAWVVSEAGKDILRTEYAFAGVLSER